MNGRVGHRVGVSCLALIVGAVLMAMAKTIAMKDLPGPVRAEAEKVIAGGTLKRVVVEREDGQDAYSVEARIAGKDKEFTFSPDGTLLAEEEDLAFAKLPDAVRAAAETYFGGSRGLRASIEIAKGVTSYEVEGRKGAQTMSVTFSAEGAMLEEEKDED